MPTRKPKSAKRVTINAFFAAETAEGFVARVCEIVTAHDPAFNTGTIVVQASRQGTYQSIRFKILATSEQQLKDLHTALTDTGLVRMVL